MAERDPGLSVDLADQFQDQRDLGRLVAFAVAHDDGRDRLLLVEWTVRHVVAAQAFDRCRHQADAGLRGYQPEGRLDLADLVYDRRL